MFESGDKKVPFGISLQENLKVKVEKLADESNVKTSKIFQELVIALDEVGGLDNIKNLENVINKIKSKG